MHIENEVKYDFSDVLIKPKRSYYTSRKEVDLERKWTVQKRPGFNVESYTCALVTKEPDKCL